MFTIRPQPRSFMCGQTAWAQLKAPVRLTRRSRSQSSGDWLWNCAAWSSVPALLTRMSTEPNSSMTRATVASTSSRSVTSHLIAAERRPSSWISRAVASVNTSPCARAACASGPHSATSESSDSTWISAITTSAPARASVRASARPSPRDPPVTSATRPERSISIATRQKYLAGDHEPLDLRGSLVDLKQLRVPHQLLDRVLLHVAVAAEDLDGVGRDLHRRVGGEPLCERRLQRRAIALVEQSAGLPGEQPWRLDLGRHVGDQEVDSLVDGDRLTEQ